MDNVIDMQKWVSARRASNSCLDNIDFVPVAAALRLLILPSLVTELVLREWMAFLGAATGSKI